MACSGMIVLLGANGMLGSDITAEAARRGVSVVGLDLPAFDITNADHLRRAIPHGGLIINCAAYTNVEKAESEPQLAEKVNAEAVGMLGNIAKQADASVLHISTDFVFDGALDRPYVETDAANPLSAYGRSKWHGEQALAASGCRYCIVRVEWTYGKHGVNFIKKLMDAAAAGKPLRVVDDQIGSPTATTEAAAALCELIAKGMPQGVFHLAASGYVSRFDMAQFMFQTLRRPVDLSPCKTSDFPSAAQRPLNSRFDCRKLESYLGRPMKPWQESLKRYLEAVSMFV